MKIEEWCAHINGQVETLTLAFASLAVTHPEHEKALSLLASILKSASQEASDLPVQKAYKDGTKAAVLQLFSAVELAKNTRNLDNQKKN